MSSGETQRAGRRTFASARAARCGAGAALLLLLLLLHVGTAGAQLRERPVAFDSAARITILTPSLAAALGLVPPAWPVSGGFVDARLYVVDDSARSIVLVVRRPDDVLERYVLTAEQRRTLAATIGASAPLETLREEKTFASTPARGGYVLNQTVLGGALFGPAAAALANDGAARAGIYLLVTGTTFFLAADRVKSWPVSAPRNHMSWHLARQGAGAGYLAAYAIGGEDMDSKGFAAAMLAGGIVGDVLGDRVGAGLSDPEAHGATHGMTVVGGLAAGVLGTAGLSRSDGSRRAAAVALVGAQALGYPLGLRYARGLGYRVTAGDVGTLVVGEALGLGAGATVLSGGSAHSGEVVAGALTIGFGAGALLADRALASRFDYTEAESRLLQIGTLAGGVVALAVPIIATANDAPAYFGAATVGGLFGAMLTHHLLEPARAGTRASAPRRTGAILGQTRYDVHFSPQALLAAATRTRGTYPVLSVDF